MDEELDLGPGNREESRTITDETIQAGCATDTPGQGYILRIKQDRREGHNGIYTGFERRGRLNSEEKTMRPPPSGRPEG
jgi:hypothetical protein